jgi:hypothetical protein
MAAPREYNRSRNTWRQGDVALRKYTALVIGGAIHRLTLQESAGRYGGRGMEELKELEDPVNAVQQVLASMGAPGNR